MAEALKQSIDNIISGRSNIHIKENDIKFLNSLITEEKEIFFNEMLNAQKECLINAFTNKRDIVLPSFCSFTIKRERQLALDVRKEEMAKLGHVHLKTLSEDEKRTVLDIERKAVISSLRGKHLSRKAADSGIFKFSKNNSK